MKHLKSLVLTLAAILLIAGITSSTYAWVTLDNIDASITINSGRTSLDIQIFYSDDTNNKWVAFNEDGTSKTSMESFDFSLNSESNTAISLLVKVGNTSGIDGELFLALSDNGSTSVKEAYEYNLTKSTYSVEIEKGTTEISYDIIDKLDSSSLEMTDLVFNEYDSILTDSSISIGEYQYYYLTLDYSENNVFYIVDYFTNDNGQYIEKDLDLDLRFDSYVSEKTTNLGN